MRQRGVGVPPSATKNLDSTCSGEGRKVQIGSNRPAFTSPTAAHGRGAVHTGSARSSDVRSRGVYKQQQAFNSFHVIRILEVRATVFFTSKNTRVKYFKNGSSLKK
jgi:hypothetical protein